jgi:hypothetical protein
MSLATVYSTAQFGLADDTTVTGLYVASITWAGSSEQALAPNHIGCDVGFAVYNAKKTVSVSGIISAKGTGLADAIGSTITLANTTHNTRTRNSEGTGETPNANAALVVIGNSIAPTSTGFEAGDMECIYLPSVATNAPTTL